VPREAKIITRTRHSKEFKIQIVKGATETGKTSVVAQRYDL